ncbi:MAG: PhoH family protein [Eubacteriales bacterium]|nr:PhoH family protein [Eubacteriales bacterium]
MHIVIEVNAAEALSEVFGAMNQNIRSIEESFDVSIEPSKEGIVVAGEIPAAVKKSASLVRRLIEIQSHGQTINPQLTSYLSSAVRDEDGEASTFEPNSICLTAKGKPISTKTAGQKRYVEAIRKNDVTFAIGPAGTGKTYLAVALAVRAFRQHEVDRIILTRPAVEAGEKLGFLPGDLQTKVDPYMRPLYDALQEMLGAELYLKNMEKGLIEVSPLAYMRGRTLDNSFIILDEAQNTTAEQMKMFLTRIGFGSKVVVTGDQTQMDLDPKQRSGLREARRILRGIDGLGFIELNASDVVRNPMVQKIIEAYERFDKKEAKNRKQH